jgi:hypothetical protein
MKLETLPPIYKKMLFWQRFVWLTSVLGLLAYAVRLMNSYGSFASANAEFEFQYSLFWFVEAAAWLAALFFVINLKKSINIGQKYEAERSRAALASWMLRMHQTAKSLLAVIILLIIESVLDQFFSGGIIL